MKVTKKLLIEIIESELSLLTEAPEKEALRGYFSLGTDVELKIKSSGRIVTALQTYLKARASQDDLKEIEGMTSTVEAMGDPDGNFGPKTEALVKLITSNIEGMVETGVYNSEVHGKIAGPAAAVEAAAEESVEETADFPHPKWDALSTEYSGFDAVAGLSAEDARNLLSTISKSGEKTFRDNFITFVNGFEVTAFSGSVQQPDIKLKLTEKMKYAIKKKLLLRKNDIPNWIKAENVSEEFDSIVDEKWKDSEFNLLIKPDEGLDAEAVVVYEEQAALELKDKFVSKFLDTRGEFIPEVEFGFGTKLTGIQDQQSVYLAINEIIEKWVIVNPPDDVPEDEPADEDTSEQLTESRFQKLAGI